MLEAIEVQVKYREREAVGGVSVCLNPGEVTALVGPNGAGKSSLLRVLNGGLRPSAGEVLLDGASINSYSRRAIAKRIAIVAQEADVRFPVTVLEFVLGGRYAWATTGAWGWETEHDLQIAQDILHETELEELSLRVMSELSGGERQRAILARALATEAGILLLDEPTANLDLAHQAGILRLVRTRCDEQKIAALVITHDINLAAEFSDQVLLMRGGQLVATGAPGEVLTADLLKQVFAVEVLVDAHPVSGAPRVTPVHRA